MYVNQSAKNDFRLFVLLIFFLTIALSLTISARRAYSAVSSGYSEYYIPGDEADMDYILDEISPFNTLGDGSPDYLHIMHCIISVTAWSENTTLYYDHWENGYNFDPDDPENTADEIYHFGTAGANRIFESQDIPTDPRNPADTYYDGKDRLYVAGGTVTVTRTSWNDTNPTDYPGHTIASTLLAVAWEIYPVHPQLIKYIMPFGEDLYNNQGLHDFNRVFALVQATEDNTVVQVDYNHDGTYDVLDQNRDGDTSDPGDDNTVELNAGDVFLLDRVSINQSTLDSGTIIQGSKTLQVHYVIGYEGSTYEIRGLTAFPRGLWDDEYYAPVDSPSNVNSNVDLYLYNPHNTTLTINYETTSGTGTFTIDPTSTRSFHAATGNYMPQNSAVDLKGSDVFWGASTIDSGASAYDWGYSLVPAVLLDNEHYVGWAPGAYPVSTGADADDSGLYLTPARDNTTIFVDYGSDGFSTAQGDDSYTLNRLESQYVYDASDGDMSNANIYSTGPYCAAYGQNPDTAPTGAPAIDVGYTTVPGVDFIDLVLTVNKSISPAVIPTTSGSSTTFTLTVASHDYQVDGISVVDTLPAGWNYDNTQDTTVITLADKTQITTDPTETTNADGDEVLTWDSGILGSMAPNQEITIVVTARTTMAFSEGDLSRNDVTAVGTRTVQGVTQTFTTTDFVFVSYSQSTMAVTKTSDVDPVAVPGDTVTYTVVVANTGGTTLNNISVYDPLPKGLHFGSGTITYPMPAGTYTYADNFTAQTYSNSDGSAHWTTSWSENNDDNSPSTGKITINTGNSRIQFRGTSGTDTFYIERTADLTGKTNRSLSFNYSENGRLENGDTMTVTVNGQQILNTSNDFGSGTYNASLESIISSTGNPVITIRYTATGFAGGGRGGNEYWYLDDIAFQFDQATDTGSASLNDPPNLVSSSDGYNLLSGESLTIQYTATLGDPLATSIDEITNTAYVTSDEINTPISDSVKDLVQSSSADTGEVGDLVWFDADGDGVKDVGEKGIANVRLALKNSFGATIATATTDGTGHYRFTGVEPGDDYFVEITNGIPAGLTQSAPSGHTDDRTDLFNLASGEVKLDADFGYKPDSGTGTIGDLVWHDADGDGFRDGGEPGLPNITVALYSDDGDGVFEFGTDTKVTETITVADGSYLFTGVTASGTEDYFVFVDATQANLSGYSPTTTMVKTVTDLDAGDVRLTNDFGFQNTSGNTYSIKDRVWYDVNEDAADDSESGIAFVTVDLLDASLNVIATTTTDADGYFEFIGIPGNGGDYTIRITDTNAKLTDYYGTTDEAKAGEVAIDNLVANLDYTVEPVEPNFGYNVNGAIGDTVFSDTDGDGVQGAGELGISGVTINLYLDDGNGNRDAGDTLTATLVTDANGNYLFSGLGDGTYFVEVDPTQAALSSYDTLTTADDDTAAGHQRKITINNDSNLDADFGYTATVQGSVSGIVWLDSNGDGTVDSGETRLEDVTVELQYAFGTPAGTVTTDANGEYTFSGLPVPGDGSSISYIVVITDTNGVLSGLNTTYEVSGGPFDGKETISLDNGNADVSDINFGYKDPVATLAVIGDFGAFNEDGKVVVRWQTVSEKGTMGFFLYRLNEKTGQYKPVNRKLLPGLLYAPAGGSYSYYDKTAKTDTYYTYRLEEVEISGNRNTYGPWQVYTGTRLSGEQASVELDAHASIAGYRLAEQSLSDEKIARLTARMNARLSAYAAKLARKGGRAKISVTEEGLYFIDAGDIAAVFDISLQKVTYKIKYNSLRLRCRGDEVAVLPAADNSGVYFYADKYSTRYTDENVYWLDIARGIQMRTVKRKPKTAPEDRQYFYQWEWAEKDVYPMTGLFSDPDADFWMWDYVFPGYGRDQVTLPISSPGAVDVDTATLTVSFQGGSDTAEGDDHHAVIYFNGTEVGSAQWGGLSPTVISAQVPAAILNDGENQVEIAGIQIDGVPYDIFYVDDLQLVYPRTYTAVENQLTAENNGYQTIRMDGFTDPDIRVFDITNPQRPSVLTKTVVEPSAAGSGDFQVSFKAGSYGGGNVLRRYLAVTPDMIKPCILIADQPSYLKRRFNLADYVIITSSDMVDAAQSLADYRTSQGHVSQVVDIEDIYDEFSYGIKNPEAIRTFLAYADSKWRIGLKYVLLAGDGSFDYKDNQGFGDSVIPAMIASTPDGLRVTDFPYSDVAGADRVPEFAVGRVPVISADELTDYIDKVKEYEAGSGNWTARATLAADAPDAGGDFIASSEEVAGLFPADYPLDKLYLDAMPMGDARLDFVADINAGRAFVNFIGHGAMFQLGNHNLFSTADISKLNNGMMLPVVTAMACVAGDFGYPGFDGLSEELVLKSSGGAVAVWAPSGYTYNQQSTELCKGFYSAVFIGGEKVIGDAIRRSQERYAEKGEKLYHLDLYNLTGDPALKLK